MIRLFTGASNDNLRYICVRESQTVLRILVLRSRAAVDFFTETSSYPNRSNSSRRKKHLFIQSLYTTWGLEMVLEGFWLICCLGALLFRVGQKW